MQLQPLAGNYSMVGPTIPRCSHGKEQLWLSPVAYDLLKQTVIRGDRVTGPTTPRFGKGKVVAVGDPWLYNEYVDGRKLPAIYQNYAGAEDLVQWLLKTLK